MDFTRRTDLPVEELKKYAKVPAMAGMCTGRFAANIPAPFAANELGIVFLTGEDPEVRRDIEIFFVQLMSNSGAHYGARFAAVCYLKHGEEVTSEDTKKTVSDFMENPANKDIVSAMPLTLMN